METSDSYICPKCGVHHDQSSECMIIPSISELLDGSQDPFVWPTQDQVTIREKIEDRKLYDALNFDLTVNEPDLNTMRIRTDYNAAYDYSILHKDQRYFVYYTYGPEEGYDVKTPNSKAQGIRIVGFFESLDEASTVIKNIRQSPLKHDASPYFCFIKFHLVDLFETNGRVPVPAAKTQGGTLTHPLNEHHAEFMKDHLRKNMKETEFVYQRREDALLLSKYNKEEVKQFNEFLNVTMKEIFEYDDVNEEQMDEIIKKYPLYAPVEKHEWIINPGRIPLEQQIVECKSTVHPKLVKKYVKLLKHQFENKLLPPSNKVNYVKYYCQSISKWTIIRIIENDKMRISEELLFIIDEKNTLFSTIKEETPPPPPQIVEPQPIEEIIPKKEEQKEFVFERNLVAPPPAPTPTPTSTSTSTSTSDWVEQIEYHFNEIQKIIDSVSKEHPLLFPIVTKINNIKKKIIK